MTRRLDQSTPFSTFHPPHNGASYWQDGGNFTAEGTLLWEDGEDAPDEPIVAPAPVEPAAPSDDDSRINLVKWLKGELNPKPKFFTVRGWAEDVYGEVLSSKDALVAHCIREGLVTPEQVKA